MRSSRTSAVKTIALRAPELLAEMGHTEQARAEYRYAAEQTPGSVRPALGANLLLPQVYESHEHLEQSRARYAEGLERLHESAAGFRFDSPVKALADLRWTKSGVSPDSIGLARSTCCTVPRGG